MELIADNGSEKFASLSTYFFYYKSKIFIAIAQEDSALIYLQKSINSPGHPQTNNGFDNYFALVDLMQKQNKINNALAYLKIIEQKMNKKTSVEYWVAFYGILGNLNFKQKKYDTAWAYRNKCDSCRREFLPLRGHKK